MIFLGKEPLCCIPLDQILAVEKLQEDSFKKNYMFQIVQPERALYIQVLFSLFDSLHAVIWFSGSVQSLYLNFVLYRLIIALKRKSGLIY